MLERITGRVTSLGEKTVCVQTGGVGFSLLVPRPTQWQLDEETTLLTYLHWSAEQGPSLFGFATALDRELFCMIIDCPKIGPSLALAILSQMDAGQFIQVVASSQHKALSALHGIGPKKAEQIVLELKDKVQKLVVRGGVQTQSALVHWPELEGVLTSLGYEKQEILKVMSNLGARYKDESPSLDTLIRSALTYLSTANKHV